MSVIADLHIHSRFSRATSKQLTPRHLAAWAQCKGINILGTGDFTHPQWRTELREQLSFDEESGFYKLNVPHETLDFMQDAPLKETTSPLFCLQTEISSIYKRGGKTRKVHNLVFVPTLEDADKLSQRLSHIGNLASDGRPILGLDSHDLLEIVLETSPDAVLVPAHIWTPWFSLFGSKSGFDQLEECFGDLSSHIFALETGLSSDPAMNRLVSALDGYALVSNSDAHSGANLGREANLFDGRISYHTMFAALRAAAQRRPDLSPDCRFLGTMEFYPEEGKYHLDGHRACGVVLEPEEAHKLNNICPVCGKPLTIGVLHRVWELADRDAAPALAAEPEARPLIPLPELIGEILGVGSGSRKVQQRYAELLRTLGPDLDILCRMPEERIRAHWDALGEAVARMRRGDVTRQGGYDGEYGVVRVFSPEEQAELGGASRRATLLPPTRRAPAPATTIRRRSAPAQPVSTPPDPAPAAFGFSAEQQAALDAGPHPVLVLAGPGSGKTRVLVGRLQRLLAQGMPPESLLALTFTRRAAAEMRERLAARTHGVPPRCDTLHGYAWSLLRKALPDCVLLPEPAARSLFAAANPALSSAERRRIWERLQLAREQGLPLEALPPAAAEAARRYLARKQQGDRLRAEYADLPGWLLLHRSGPHTREEAEAAASWLPPRLREAAGMPPGSVPTQILVDEAQDLSPIQLSLIRALLPPDGTGFFGIGDPDQAIYGFRGAGGQSEDDFRRFWPTLEVLRLGVSYRAGQPVLDMAQRLLQGHGHCGSLTAARPQAAFLHLFAASDDQAEARWIARRAVALLGATSHSLLDATRQTELDGTLSPGDIAVLVRLRAQIPPIRAALEQAGIPCAAPESAPFWQDPLCAAVLRDLCGLPPDATDRGNDTADEPGEAQRLCLPPLPRTDGSVPPPAALADWLAAHAALDPALLSGGAWQELRHLWDDCGSWPALLERIALLRERDLVRSRAEHVQLMTLHASKGLEFRAVFLPGLEEGLLPLRRAALGMRAEDEESPLEEERRLLYVGLTRAACAIFASHCGRRRLYGKELRLPPSSFLPLVRDCCRITTLKPHTRREQHNLSLL